MDHLSNLKGRIGEAFVETVLRQAFYKVSRLGRESQLQHMFKSRRCEFLPDFLVWKGVGTSPEGAPLHRMLCVEVKYRANIQDYLRQHGAELLSDIGEDWPELYVIFVTDHPDEGRSCFQLLHLEGSDAGVPLSTTDLHEARSLGIRKDLVERQTELVTQIFSLLRASSAQKNSPRKPPVKIPSGGSVSLEAGASA
jgi:hypothetical protein